MIILDYKRAKTEKAKYDKVYLQMNNSSNELKGYQSYKKPKQEKIALLESNLKRDTEIHNTVGQQTLNIVEDTFDILEIEMMERICDLVDLYREFFSSGMKFLTEQVPKIYSYKSYIEQKRDDLGIESTNENRRTYLQRRETRQNKVIIFGISLEIICQREKRNVPLFFTKWLSLLEEKGAIIEEGIFRISGRKRDIDTLREAVEEDPNIDIGTLPESEDIHSVCGFIKLWLRSLPSPLFPPTIYNELIDVPSFLTLEEKINALKKLIANISPIHRSTISYLLKFLYTISLNVSVNKMGPVNLSTVITPNIIFVEEINDEKGDYFQQAALQNASVALMIQEYPKIFDETEEQYEEPLEDHRLMSEVTVQEGGDYQYDINYDQGNPNDLGYPDYVEEQYQTIVVEEPFNVEQKEEHIVEEEINIENNEGNKSTIGGEYQFQGGDGQNDDEEDITDYF